MPAGETIDLGIDLEATFDHERALTMTQAAKRIRGRRGHLNMEVCQRFANPKHGCRPQGPGGPRLVLPSVKINGQLLTMLDWVEAFNAARLRYGLRARQQPPLATPARKLAAAHKRAERELQKAGVGK